MDYKEKYEQGLECIQEILSSGEEKIKMTLLKERLQPFFPELESEDERIRKWLLDTITQIPNDSIEWDVIEKAKVLAWLEKQSKRDARYENLEELLEADTIYQMSMNDAMVENAKTKAMNALSELEIGKLLGIEKQGEQNPIINVPTREVILAIWDLGNEWKELTDGDISTEYGTQLDYIQKHWHESEYYLREKQGKKKTTNKVEPKFKVDDWIANDYCTGKVIALTDDAYLLDSGQGIPFSCEHNAHLWTIDDAKDGDVLYSLDSKQPFIFKHRKPNEQAAVYCGLNIYGKFFVWGTKDCIITLSNYIPATKEQRDTLLKAMADAGYTFDFEKKELKLLISNGGDFESDDSEQKPTWSEEDEEILKNLIDYFSLDDGLRLPTEETIDWLKSLKKRML